MARNPTTQSRTACTSCDGLAGELFEGPGSDVVLDERLCDAVAVEVGLGGLLPWPDLVERADHEAHQHGHRDVVPVFEQPRQQVREGDDARRGSDDEDHDDGNVQIAHGLHDILVFAQQQQDEGPGDAGQDHGADGDGARKHHEPPVVGGFCGRGDGVHQAAAAPATNARRLRQSQRPICRATSSAEAMINPKKNDQMAMGW